MKIYSWNMLFNNREQDRVFNFISESDFDIFCLQEVSNEFLKKIKTLPYQIAYAIESDLISYGKQITIFNVIISKFPIISSSEIPLKYYEPELPLRSRLTARIIHNLKDLRAWTKGLGNRHALYADIEMHKQNIRVFNLHLPLMHPRIRSKEFGYIMLQKNPELQTIVCGDFNVLEKPHITPLNWVLGGNASDAIRYGRERTIIEKHFVGHELINPLNGKSTHPLSRSQLDHILVSNSFSIKNAEVIRNRYGSDHHPIRVEIESST